MDTHRISAGSLAASIAAFGAEPQSIAHTTYGEVLWQAGPAWPKHAPVLFPIVGELAGGVFRHAGHEYALARHGFARTSAFAWIERAPSQCSLRLVDDAQTRACYPFAFELTIAYAIEDDRFVATFTLHNTGDVTLPASLGAHPAFCWPLRTGVAKKAHTLTFERDEPEAIRRLDGNLLSPIEFVTPIEGRTLVLRPALFDADAMVLDAPHSTSVRYTAPGAPVLEIAWHGFTSLGIWSKAPGDFVCVEPWQGYADPLGFAGDFERKPGLALLWPGESRAFGWSVRVS